MANAVARSIAIRRKVAVKAQQAGSELVVAPKAANENIAKPFGAMLDVYAETAQITAGESNKGDVFLTMRGCPTSNALGDELAQLTVMAFGDIASYAFDLIEKGQDVQGLLQRSGPIHKLVGVVYEGTMIIQEALPQTQDQPDAGPASEVRTAA